MNLSMYLIIKRSVGLRKQRRYCNRFSLHIKFYNFMPCIIATKCFHRIFFLRSQHYCAKWWWQQQWKNVRTVVVVVVVVILVVVVFVVFVVVVVVVVVNNHNYSTIFAQEIFQKFKLSTSPTWMIAQQTVGGPYPEERPPGTWSDCRGQSHPW